jgi:hypothetical protein
MGTHKIEPSGDKDFDGAHAKWRMEQRKIRAFLEP